MGLVLSSQLNWSRDHHILYTTFIYAYVMFWWKKMHTAHVHRYGRLNTIEVILLRLGATLSFVSWCCCYLFLIPIFDRGLLFFTPFVSKNWPYWHYSCNSSVITQHFRRRDGHFPVGLEYMAIATTFIFFWCSVSIVILK